MLIPDAHRFCSFGAFILFAVIPTVMIFRFDYSGCWAGSFAARGQEKEGEENVQKNSSHVSENPKNSIF